MPPGAPRKTSFPPEEMVKLGEEMLEWIDSQEEVLHLSQWYTIEKGFLYSEWKAFIQLKEFLPYYEIALKKMGLQYIRKDSPVEPSLKQRWQRVYFKDLREQEDQDKEDDIKREAALQHGVAADYEDKLMKIASQLQRTRDEFSSKKRVEDK